ncbi:MAG: methyltransferase [Rhodobacteraceae bacterium]|jgi:phospholipid N-methyltransferase|nr:methyltransferase [Paracoccaceae bacterium]
MSDTLSFLRNALIDPRRVGAVAPSGRALAELITSALTPAAVPVLEIGPGTGVFTRAILARGIAESDLWLVEFGAEFAAGLRRAFPRASVLHADASRLRGLPALAASPRFGAAVSGLPILSMGSRRQMRIVGGVFDLLRPEASLYQFTYGPVCPVPRAILARLGLRSERIAGTLLNLPPASVYRIFRAAAH